MKKCSELESTSHPRLSGPEGHSSDQPYSVLVPSQQSLRQGFRMGGVWRRCSRSRGLGRAGGGQRRSKDLPRLESTFSPTPRDPCTTKGAHRRVGSLSRQSRPGVPQISQSLCGGCPGGGEPGGGHLPGEVSPVWLKQPFGARGSCELLAANSRGS